MVDGEGVCTGKNTGDSCNDNRECGVSLFCSKKTCQKVTKIGAACNANNHCAFGSLCNNGTCMRFGSVEIGQKLNVTQALSKVWTIQNGYLCKSFFVNSNNVCAWGPSPNFDDFSKENTGDSCSYNVTDPVSNVTTTISEPATCGFN